MYHIYAFTCALLVLCLCFSLAQVWISIVEYHQTFMLYARCYSPWIISTILWAVLLKKCICVYAGIILFILLRKYTGLICLTRIAPYKPSQYENCSDQWNNTDVNSTNRVQWSQRKSKPTTCPTLARDYPSSALHTWSCMTQQCFISELVSILYIVFCVLMLLRLMHEENYMYKDRKYEIL